MDGAMDPRQPEAREVGDQSSTHTKTTSHQELQSAVWTDMYARLVGHTPTML